MERVGMVEPTTIPGIGNARTKSKNEYCAVVIDIGAGRAGDD